MMSMAFSLIISAFVIYPTTFVQNSPILNAMTLYKVTEQGCENQFMKLCNLYLKRFLANKRI